MAKYKITLDSETVISVNGTRVKKVKHHVPHKR